jgi:hypothetical protein
MRDCDTLLVQKICAARSPPLLLLHILLHQTHDAFLGVCDFLMELYPSLQPITALAEKLRPEISFSKGSEWK